MNSKTLLLLLLLLLPLLLLLLVSAGLGFCTSAGISIPNANNAEAAKKICDELQGKLKTLSLLRPGITLYWTPGVTSCKIEVYGMINPEEIEAAKLAENMVLKDNSGVSEIKLIFIQNEVMEPNAHQTLERNYDKEKIIKQYVLKK